MSVPEWFTGQYYTEFLSEICRQRNVLSYLEIGVMHGDSLAGIVCSTAIGVDPCFLLTKDVTKGKAALHLYQTTSDRFFAEIDARLVIGGDLEMAFLDGLHAFEVLLRDFSNTEAICSPASLIAIHDCMPLAPEMIDRNLAAGVPDGPYKGYWTGDVWKIVPILRKYRPDLTVALVDCPPTGLVLVTGLDPTSRILQVQYDAIVREFEPVPNDAASMQRLYQENAVVSFQLAKQNHAGGVGRQA